jgi:hypothetical protein
MPLKHSAWTHKALTPTTFWAWLTPIKGGLSRLSNPSVRLSGLPPGRSLFGNIIFKSGVSISKEPDLKTFKKKEDLNEKTG